MRTIFRYSAIKNNSGNKTWKRVKKKTQVRDQPDCQVQKGQRAANTNNLVEQLIAKEAWPPGWAARGRTTLETYHRYVTVMFWRQFEIHGCWWVGLSTAALVDALQNASTFFTMPPHCSKYLYALQNASTLFKNTSTFFKNASTLFTTLRRSSKMPRHFIMLRLSSKMPRHSSKCFSRACKSQPPKFVPQIYCFLPPRLNIN